MGDWAIVIRGTGSHHNKKYPNDANRMAAEFVAQLRAKGHVITHASITYGAEDIFCRQPGYQGAEPRAPEDYLADRDKIEGDGA